MITAKFERDKLSSALAAVNSVQMESELGFVQIAFTGHEKVIFSSMNDNTSVQYETDTTHEGSGIIKVPGKQFLEYVRQLPKETISAAVENPSQLELNCGFSSARMQLVQEQIFTKITPVANGSAVTLKGELIARWISAFKDFISYDDFRFYVNGALLWLQNDGTHCTMHTVASDAIRLVQSTIFEDFKVSATDGEAVIIPKRVFEELRRIALAEPEKEFTLKWNAKELSFTAETDNYMLSAKCITGVYPPYQTALPKAINTSVEVELKTMLECLKRGLIFTNTQDRIIHMRFEGSGVKVSGATPGLKEAQELITLSSPVRNPFEVHYNGQFLYGILNLLNGSYATFHWENVDRPVKITGEPERGLSSFYLLVPTRY